ncbi:MAG: hypothetical protein EOO12_00305 [Chitinophagaceae bacterium]|nr:MAG: hypothetical protein EOO12_00305 [Chitinophagaceae bacterium]
MSDDEISISLDEKEVEEIIRKHIEAKLGKSLPEGTEFWWLAGQEIFSGVWVNKRGNRSKGEKT